MLDEHQQNLLENLINHCKLEEVIALINLNAQGSSEEKSNYLINLIFNLVNLVDEQPDKVNLEQIVNDFKRQLYKEDKNYRDSDAFVAVDRKIKESLELAVTQIQLAIASIDMENFIRELRNYPKELTKYFTNSPIKNEQILNSTMTEHQRHDPEYQLDNLKGRELLDHKFDDPDSEAIKLIQSLNEVEQQGTLQNKKLRRTKRDTTDRDEQRSVLNLTKEDGAKVWVAIAKGTADHEHDESKFREKNNRKIKGKHSIGTGASGRVKYCIVREHNRDKVKTIKIIDLKAMIDKNKTSKENIITDLKREAEVQKLANNDECEIIVTDDKAYLISDFILGKPLRETLNNTKMSFIDRLIISIAMTNDLHKLHQANIIHGDIKPDNMQISEDMRVKHCDFGYSRIIENQTKVIRKKCGSYGYVAPEVFSEEKLSQKADIHSLLASMFGMTSMQTSNLMAENGYANNRCHRTNRVLVPGLGLSNAAPDEFKPILDAIFLAIDSKYRKRPSADEILNYLVREIALKVQVSDEEEQKIRNMLDIMGIDTNRLLYNESKRLTDEDDCMSLLEPDSMIDRFRRENIPRKSSKEILFSDTQSNAKPTPELESTTSVAPADDKVTKEPDPPATQLPDMETTTSIPSCTDEVAGSNRFLIRKQEESNGRKDGNNEAHIAAKEGNIDKLQSIFDSGKIELFKQKNKASNSPLHAAINNIDDMDQLQKVIQFFSDINKQKNLGLFNLKNKKGQNALSQAQYRIKRKNLGQEKIEQFKEIIQQIKKITESPDSHKI